MQGFNWESCKQQWWDHMAGQADFIASCGFTVVWLPPPTDSVSREGYMCGACCGRCCVPSLQSAALFLHKCNAEPRQLHIRLLCVAAIWLP